MTHEIVPADDVPRAQRLSITEAMATHFNMEPNAFMATMRATVFAKGMSREEEAAFLLVAKHHNLNPVTREIYAMPKKGGGIIPVVSIDGWVRMANEHHAFDGMEFEDHHDGAVLVSTTCRIYRKDRSHPIAVTEYLEECKRDTEPWKMKYRMLRHKAMIQCARYAFGFAGVYDPDEAERFAEPLASSTRRAPSPSTAPMIEARAEAPDQRADMVVDDDGVIKPETRRQPEPAIAQPTRRAPSPSATPAPQPSATASVQQQTTAPQYNPEKMRAAFDADATKAADRDALNEAWERHVGQHWDRIPEGHPDKSDLDRLYRVHAARVDGEEGAVP